MIVPITATQKLTWELAATLRMRCNPFHLLQLDRMVELGETEADQQQGKQILRELIQTMNAENSQPRAI